MKVKKNDTVLILTGKDAGKTGKIIESIPSQGKVKVEGVNVQKKSKKARSAKETSAIVEQIGAIDVSNVQVVCPVCSKATRVAMTIVDGKKVRTCKKCGASLDTTKEAKSAAKKATKKTADEKPATKKRTTKKTEDGAEKPVRKTSAKKVTEETAE
jgi:large subunit ribosomal protein L24